MSTETQPGADGICRGQEHYQHGGPARGHVGCTFHGTPATAFPFVGARAQVTVAEWDDGALSATLRAGDTVTLRRQFSNGEWHAQRDDGKWGYVAARRLRPVAVSPRPDQPTDCEDWRESSETNARALTLAIARLNRDRRALARVKAERDAARAELAAAHNTDGLGLPQVEVRRAGRLLTAIVDGFGEWLETSAGASLPRLRADTAAHVALLRARLADEATPEDGARA